MGVRKRMLNKLKSKKGSALLLAMFFSMICIILGMVVLAAGETANGRIVNAAKAEQSYYVVESLFREIEHETSYSYTPPLSSEAVTVNMKLRMNTASMSDPSFNFNTGLGSIFVITPASGAPRDNAHRLTTLKPFVATALYQAMTGTTYSNELTYTLGGSGALADTTYTVKVQMTVQPTDYSIYLEVTDVTKGTGTNAESLGVPNLHTIAIQCKKITPISATSGSMTDAVFEYYPAKFVQ